MNNLLILILIILINYNQISTIGLNRQKLKTTFLKNIYNEERRIYGSFTNDVLENFIIQPLDHFDNENTITYQQRYFVNKQHWKEEKGPVFLYIGGEGTLTAGRAIEGFIVSAAKDYNALVFAVEHRYYGVSLNNESLKLENLKYLSSHQALSDLVSFHSQMTKLYNLGSTNKWVCFGGSYLGSLSAWFRLKFPHLVSGAVASSAPVEALLDFKQYNQVVSKSISNPIIGGSENCYQNTKAAFTKLDKLIENRQMTKLSNDFLSCQPLNAEDALNIFQFTSNLIDIFENTVQYNKLGKSNFEVASLCENMTYSEDVYQNLVNLNKRVLSFTKERCWDNSWSNFINQILNVSISVENPGFNMRQWLYQTCSQFGYYQTCEEDCPFSKYINLAPNLLICQKVYSTTAKRVYDSVDFTNEFYGSTKPVGSNILFVNGQIDPWHSLSVLKDLSSTVEAIVIPDTAHCADMHDPKIGDSQDLINARNRIKDTIGNWLR